MRNDAGINGDAQRIEQMAWMLFLKVYDEKENDWELDDDDYKSIIPEECRWRNWAHDDGGGNALTGDELLSFVNNTLFVELKKIEVTPTTPILRRFHLVGRCLGKQEYRFGQRLPLLSGCRYELSS